MMQKDDAKNGDGKNDDAKKGNWSKDRLNKNTQLKNLFCFKFVVHFLLILFNRINFLFLIK